MAAEDALPVKLRYRNDSYTIDGGHWRGPDGHVVHLLTWITDDLHRLEETVPRGPDPDLDAARKVAARLGSDAEVVREDETRSGPR